MIPASCKHLAEVDFPIADVSRYTAYSSRESGFGRQCLANPPATPLSANHELRHADRQRRHD